MMDNQKQEYDIYQQEESINIKKYIFLFLSKWYWFAITIGLGLSIAYLVNRYSESVYKVSSSIIVSEDNSDIGGIESLVEDMFRNRRRRRAMVENEISILKSYKLAQIAIEELDFGISYTSVGKREIAESKMYKNTPFVVVLDTAETNIANYTVYVTILSDKKVSIDIDDKYDIQRELFFGENFKSEPFNFKIELRDAENFMYDKEKSNKYYFRNNSVNGLANIYKNKLSINVNDEKGSILFLSMTGFVAQQTSDYLNKIMEVYIQSDLNEKNKKAANTIVFIDEQLNNLVDSLEIAETRLQNFRLNNQIVNLSQKGQMIYTKLEKLQERKSELNLRTKYFNYIKQFLAKQEYSGPVISPTIIDIENPMLDKLITKYNEKILQRSVLSFSAKEEVSLIVILDKEIRELKTVLNEQIASSFASNKITHSDINGRLKLVENEVRQLPIDERKLVNIERKYKINNELYTYLLEKRAEAGITKASNVADNKILDIAMAENAFPISPKRSQNYIIGFVIGLMIPSSIILIIDFMNNKVMEKRDIEDNTNIPIVGTIGHNDTQTDNPVFTNPKSSMAESFRALRTNLQFTLSKENEKVITVSSTISGEGKTFAAINLATILAMGSKKTLLVGLDLRKPNLHKRFNLPNAIGLSTYLINNNNIDEIIYPSNIDNLYIATSGPVPPNPAELIETDKMNDFFEYARQHFDYIVIDTPPVAIVTDALLLNQFADANLFVIRQKYSRKQVFDLINNLQKSKKAKNMSILVNDIKVPKYYGYGYSYGYTYGYGYGYGYGHGYYGEEDTKKKNNWFNLR
ncbi:MAG: polysaccharide biosynthesis tyrosine autokinase [Bacteroidales bacterium]|jgi:tyrosine-protein kinase Etk/Wzc|nr:polysaccharide biosynthesis tyrosine autokinase [Bacteroidales bacterium]